MIDEKPGLVLQEDAEERLSLFGGHFDGLKTGRTGWIEDSFLFGVGLGYV